MTTMDCIPVLDGDLARNSRRRGEYRIEVDKVTEAEWASLMDQFDDANIYQTWAYGAVRWQENNLSHLVLKCGSDVVGIAQLRIVRPGNLPFGIAYLRWGPMCQARGTELDPEIMRLMSAALRAEYVEKRGLFLEIVPNAFIGSARVESFRSAFQGFDESSDSNQYRTLVLDLAPPLDDLRKKLDKKWRNQLNGALRNNIEVVQGNGSEHFEQFCGLYKQMWQRKRFDSTVSIEEFLRIQERLPEAQRLKVFIGRQDGKPVAGVVCSALGDSAIYLLGATNEDGMKLKASYLLQWTVIELLRASGIRHYDLGGIDPVANPGVHHFKSGLSGADLSQIGAFTACESSLSASFVKVGQSVRGRVRALRQRMIRTRLAEAAR